MGISNKYLLTSTLILSSAIAQAVPVDMKGTLGFDTTIIKDVRRTNDSCTVADGSQCISDEENNARLQSMVLKLNPTMVVNDSVTIKGELSTGSTRGAKLGEDTKVPTNGGSPFTQSASSGLNINQIYAEIYADTALYRVGRFAKNYGLGAVLSSGEKSWDRFFSGYEGIEAQLKLGNFHLTPMWAKLDTDASKPNGKYDAYESSITALYDNTNRNLKVGVYYASREVESNSDLYGTNKGAVSATLIDVFVEKKWEKARVALEVPMLSGKAGTVYGNTSAQDFESKAYILESSYKANNKWTLGLDAGLVNGNKGDSNKIESMYLNPNYQIAEVMFKFNNRGFNDSNYDVYNSSIVNATYAKLFANYNNDAWTWKFALIWAKANEVASNGKDFYDHTTMKYVTANEDQENALGTEFDMAFDYQWNSAVVVSGFLGYHFVGDFYKFDNNANTEISTSNVMASGMRLSVNF